MGFFPATQGTTNTAQGKREETSEDLTASAKELFLSVHQIKDIDGKTMEQLHPLTILKLIFSLQNQITGGPSRTFQ